MAKTEQTRKNRNTGFPVILRENGTRRVLLCKEHNSQTTPNTKREALRLFTRPEEFCAHCAAIIAKIGRRPVSEKMKNAGRKKVSDDVRRSNKGNVQLTKKEHSILKKQADREMKTLGQYVSEIVSGQLQGRHSYSDDERAQRVEISLSDSDDEKLGKIAAAEVRDRTKQATFFVRRFLQK